MKRIRILALLAAAAALTIGLGLQLGDVNAANAVSTQVEVKVAPTLSGTVGLASASATATALSQFTLANGTGANQGDLVYTTSAAITTAGTLSIDVKGSLTDAFGAAFTPAKLRLIYIASKSSNTTDLTLFGDAASVPILNTAATTTTLSPGDVFMVTRRSAAGIAVTASTADIIKIVNGAGATANIEVVLVGSSS
jgi:hypothetical protein